MRDGCCLGRNDDIAERGNSMDSYAIQQHLRMDYIEDEIKELIMMW